MKISFIGIGAQKCASTWVYDILLSHPDVCLSKEKELHYFSHNFARGHQWYEAQLSHFSSQKVVGEISPSYFHESCVASRVAQYNQDMRIVLSLRNPIDRAYSNHKHNVRHGFLTGDLSFENGLESNPTYVERGLYATHLKRWLKHFDRSQIHVLLFDDVIENPDAVEKSLYRFLDIDTSVSNALAQEASNVSNAFRNTKVALSVDKFREQITKSKLKPIWQAGKMLGLKHVYRKLNEIPIHSAVPPMKQVTREKLSVTFNNEIIELEQILEISLDKWLS